MKLAGALRKVFSVGNIVIILALMCVWVLLMESISLGTLISGFIFSVLTAAFCNSALPLGKITNVNFFKLDMYPLYLLGQVYVAGFHVIKLIFTGAQAEIIQVKTDITNESLRILLVDSVTLTPGSVLIKLDGDHFTLLWLKGSGDENMTEEERDYAIKGKLEKWLIAAQK